MYEKLSPQLEHVVRVANEIAREYGDEFVGTEHLLLAILRPAQGDQPTAEGSLLHMLSARDVDEIRAKRIVERLIMDRSRGGGLVVGPLPGSPHFQHAMSAAIEEARSRKSKLVATEHLLVALMREQGSVACAALEELAITPDDVYASLRGEAE